MLDFCRVTFRIKLLSTTHVGSGEEVPLQDLCAGETRTKHLAAHRKNAKAGDADPGAMIRLVQRGATTVEVANGRTAGKDTASARVHLPCIEGTSLRGPLRHLAQRRDEEWADRLLGPFDLERTAQGEPEAASEGERGREGEAGAADTEARLWLAAAHADPDAEPANDCSELPFWDPLERSFILTGNRRHRDFGAVERGLLYQTEYLPAGIEFECEAVYRGPHAKFECEALPLFRLMARGRGFALGGEKGYGIGRACLVDNSLTVIEQSYDARQRTFVASRPHTPSVERDDDHHIAIRELTLVCPGPFLIQDPYRAAGLDEVDLTELRGGAQSPFMTGKPVMQALRAIAARLETDQFLLANDFAYEHRELRLDNPERALKPEEHPRDLTCTQRLFGVPGWGKTLSVEAVDVEHAQRYRAQGIQLDTYTQGPIDGALVEVDCPAGTTLNVALAFDRARYRDLPKLLETDEAFLDQVLEDAFGQDRAFRLGHAGGAGFGWFEKKARAETPETEQGS